MTQNVTMKNTTMNKYIKTDLQDSIKLMRVAIMNAFNDIETGEETRINLGPYISQPLLLECLQEAKWEITRDEMYSDEMYSYYETKTLSGKKVIIELEEGDLIIFSTKYIPVTVSICLSSDTEIEVPIDFDEYNGENILEAVEEQIFLPTDALKQTGHIKEWTIDDFAVV